MSTAPLRNTRQRAAVISALADAEVFKSSQEIHDDLRQRGESVGLATVYRTLQALADSGDVDVIVRDGETAYRQCSPSHHHHLVCRRCHSTIEVEAPDVETWANRVASDHGFVDVTHTVEVYGLCPLCARA
ncbi:MAG: Fur family transcriptional regulator [Candidatus Nanopelagicales bacterium]|jgi:Fur family ferric uptake transcriptional regulator